MKPYNKFIAAAAAVLSVAACSDAVGVDMDIDIENADSYVSIYMSQANSVPNVKNVYISEESQSFQISAYYGGPKELDHDITVEFEIRPDLVNTFNDEKGTDYKALPECYELSAESALISKGNKRTSEISLSIDTRNLMVAEPYLLPVSVKSVSDNTPVLEKLSVAYFVVMGSYLPGQVPTEKVYSFGNPVTKPVFSRGADIVFIDETDQLTVLTRGEDGTYGNPRVIGTGWGGISIMFSFGKEWLACRNPWGNLTRYLIDDGYNFLGQADFGWGWGNAQFIFPIFDKCILNVDGGVLNKFPVSPNLDFDFGNIGPLSSSGWDRYSAMFSFKDNIIAIDAGGNMWATSLSESYSLGTTRKIGTGWDMYTYVFACEDSLLAIDEKGDMYKYNFNPLAFWPLKDDSAE